MATLTLKNVPEPLLKLLKKEAKRSRRSLNQEALARLESSVRVAKRSGAETVKALRRLHRSLGRLRPLTDSFLEHAKREGRA